jgi:CheY-like chemotaxis protein
VRGVAIQALPIDPDHLFAPTPQGKSGNGVVGQSLQRRVLVVDDDIDNARALTYLLAMLGYKVEYAINGIAALKMAQSFVPHVLILDLKLPDTHGAELARQLRRDPILKTSRIIAITGSTFQGDVDRAIQAGCDEVLAKPVPLEVLERRIRAVKLEG